MLQIRPPVFCSQPSASSPVSFSAFDFPRAILCLEQDLSGAFPESSATVRKLESSNDWAYLMSKQVLEEQFSILRCQDP